MLNSALEFLKKEKRYSLALIALVLFYGFFLIQKHGSRENEMQEPPAALQEFKDAEHRLQAKIKDLGSIETYLKDRPDLTRALNIFSLFTFTVIFLGFVIDFRLIFSRSFRQKLRQPPPPAFAVEWKFSMLFKFLIWFFGLNLIWSLFLLNLKPLVPWNENLYILLHTSGVEIISFYLAFKLVQQQGGRLASLGLWVPANGFKEVKIAWTLYAAIIPVFILVLVAILIIAEWLHYDPPPHPLVPIFLEEETRAPGIVIYSLILAAIFGPVFEEIFFRGFLYPILKSRMGKWGGMILTSALFALIHDNTFAFWPIFVLGLGLNYLYDLRGSLAAPMTMHITHNFIFLSYFFLAKNIVGQEIGR